MWEPTAEIQAAAAAPSRAIGCGGDRRGKRSAAPGREGTGRERQSRSGPGARGCGSWGRRRERGHRAARRAARRGEGAAAGSALIGRAGRAGPGATRHRGAGAAAAAAETTPPYPPPHSARGGPGRERRRAGTRRAPPAGRRTPRPPPRAPPPKMEAARRPPRCRRGRAQVRAGRGRGRARARGDATRPARLVWPAGRPPWLSPWVLAGEAGAVPDGRLGRGHVGLSWGRPSGSGSGGHPYVSWRDSLHLCVSNGFGKNKSRPARLQLWAGGRRTRVLTASQEPRAPS